MKLKRVPLAGLLFAVAACHVVRPVSCRLSSFTLHHPDVVWVTYTDNSFVPVQGPRIVGDSLMGTWQGLSEPIAISLGEIQTVQARIPAPKRTILLVGVVMRRRPVVCHSRIATAGNSGDPDFLGCPRVKGTPLPDCPQD